MRDLARLALVLGAICLVAAVALSQVHRVTEEPIAQALEAEAKQAAAQVLAPVLDEGATLEKRVDVAGREAVYLALGSDRAVRGVALKVRDDGGYSGLIVSMIGVDAAGNLIGHRVVQHAETPGLGANIATDEKWRQQALFKNGEPRNLDNTDWRVKKDGGEIDALTGATITPRAVVASIKNGLAWVRDNREVLFGSPAVVAEPAAEATPEPEPVVEPTPDAKLEAGGTVSQGLPAGQKFPQAAKTPLPITGNDLTE